MGRIVQNLYIQHGSQSTQALRTDPQPVYFFVELQAQFLGARGRPAPLQFVDIDRFHHAPFCQQHGLLGGTTDSYTQDPRRAPAGAHGRHGVQDPCHQIVTWVQDRELRLVL